MMLFFMSMNRSPWCLCQKFLLTSENRTFSLELMEVCTPMKTKTLRSLVSLTVPLFASPAWAQTNDPAVEQGAGVIAWIFVGLIAGYLASRLVNKTGEGTVRDIILGIIGGIVGGILFRALGQHGVTGFNIWSLFVAFLGAVVVLVLYHTFSGRHQSV
jgi:uncharacterized membrane protein YeaQ/YmgE (transglycosylase-associated protein family)